MSQSLADKAYSIAKSEILTCALEPGQQIVQSKLAERYHIGLTPIREALQRLALEGYVQPIPRFGYIVSPVTISDVHEIYELRSIVESAAVRLAAMRGSQEQLSEILASADFTYVYKDRQSYVEFLARNVDFHRSIAVAAGNQRLVDLVSRLLEELTRVFHLGLHLRDSAEEMRGEHLALAQALHDRDPDRAEQIIQRQNETSQIRVLEALTRRAGGSFSSSLSSTVQVKRLEP